VVPAEHVKPVKECLLNTGTCIIWSGFRNLSLGHSPCALHVLVGAMVTRTNSC
jgi:hypothetical protein